MTTHGPADREASLLEATLSQNTETVDAIVIGAGLGGLLSAAHLVRRGKRVVLLERLPHSGGRFTAKNFHGVQVSTGAVHMIPFGSSGVLAHMLRRLDVPHRFFDADVFGSFHVHGKQYRSRGVLGVSRFLGPRQFLGLLYIGYLLYVQPLPRDERALPFDLWLERKLDGEKYPLLRAFFAAIARFALSVELSEISVAEVARTSKNMFLYGAPAIVQGGCGELTRELEHYVIARGGDVRLSCEVLQILQEDGHVTGVRIRERGQDTTHGEEKHVLAPLVISDVGPRATHALLANRKVTQAAVLKQRDGEEQLHEAVGLKVHILSDVSLIPHKGIMYCLDTQRIAGMVQPTNSDPSLAPAGKHLLISHQVIQSDNVEEERTLALADLHTLFGEQFDRHCRVLTMGTYRGEWPVNRMAQGEDVAVQMSLHGLYLVGDAVKPTGYLMVEGVAQSVNQFLDLLEDLDSQKSPDRASIRDTYTKHKHQERYVMPLPSRFNVLRWLWKAPGNSGR